MSHFQQRRRPRRAANGATRFFASANQPPNGSASGASRIAHGHVGVLSLRRRDRNSFTKPVRVWQLYCSLYHGPIDAVFVHSAFHTLRIVDVSRKGIWPAPSGGRSEEGDKGPRQGCDLPRRLVSPRRSAYNKPCCRSTLIEWLLGRKDQLPPAAICCRRRRRLFELLLNSPCCKVTDPPRVACKLVSGGQMLAETLT